jgi:hypothetical protein
MSSDIAIDEIRIGSETQPTTLFYTPKRTSAQPVSLDVLSADFDTKDHSEGWHTEFREHAWIQTDGEMADAFGMYGPASDWNSVTGKNKLNIHSLAPRRLKNVKKVKKMVLKFDKFI